MADRVVTAHIPASLAREVELEHKRHELTRGALDDVDSGGLIDHAEIVAWAAGLALPKRRSRR